MSEINLTPLFEMLRAERTKMTNLPASTTPPQCKFCRTVYSPKHVRCQNCGAPKS